MKKILSICVYCGSSNGNNQIYIQAAKTLGQQLAKAGIGLVYGGGTRGIMGAVSQAVKANGGHVTGIIPKFLLDIEAHKKDKNLYDEFILTETMHERKQKMFERSDAFLALPGGIGTLEEIVEITTWAQLERHQKPIGFVNVNSFWNPMITLLDHMKSEGFLHIKNEIAPLIIDDIDRVVEKICTRSLS